MSNGDLYEQLVEAMHGIYGAHRGRRALHAKGTWCEGTFTATADATKLSRAAHLQGQPVEALVRFSNGSGDPESHDGQREVRGMAVKLRPDNGDETDILATTARAHATRTPEDFLEFLKLRRPDPETGQPDMEKLGAFLGEHPECQPAIQSVIGVEPPASFATITYFSPHSFKLVDGDGNGTWVRYRWRPVAGEATIPDDEARERGRDYLRDELADRLRAGTVEFDLLLQLPGDDDPIEDPSAVWPDERELLVGGTLDVTAVIDDPEGGGHIEVFDPMRLADGVEPSDDPVLHARPKAYSVSAYERLG
jgi:catalase